MIYFTYLKDAGTSHCEKMRVGGPQTFFFEFNAISQKQGKKECERSEIDHHLDYHPVLQFLLRSLQGEFDSKCISKSQTFVQKFNFTSFSPKFFLTIFLVKSKLSTAKKSKTTTFSRVFHPKKIDNFSRGIKDVNS